ncbi:MAG: glycosyltransferase family A protein, partial [Ekhidna sp.]
MIKNLQNQTYPHECLEWVVVGDENPETEESFLKVFKQLPTIRCKYFKCDISNGTGSKRNFAVSCASSKILINLDDDDFYNKTYIAYSVSQMKEHRVPLAGCRDML